jgi:metal-sulfur cluster biosynthetic enzyme
MMTVADEPKLREAIVERLRLVIDPETGADIMRMQLVQGLEVDAEGHVSYTFRPSSPLCPLAVYLASQIKEAVATVPGVSSQHIRVEGYIASEDLTQLMNEEN